MQCMLMKVAARPAESPCLRIATAEPLAGPSHGQHDLGANIGQPRSTATRAVP